MSRRQEALERYRDRNFGSDGRIYAMTVGVLIAATLAAQLQGPTPPPLQGDPLYEVAQLTRSRGHR